ncbi:hypothetical protein ACG7TL_007933 [Trametes sanguinea]
MAPPRTARTPTARQLRQQLEEATARLTAAEQAREENATALQAAQHHIEEQEVALAAAATQVEAAQAAAAHAAAAAAGPQAPAVAQPVRVPKPRVPRGKTMKIQEAMGLDDFEYGEIRYKIHGLVHAAGLEWTLDFRHQEVEKLSRLFSAATEACPVLDKYVNHWATAAIAARYMQNLRRYARTRGVLAAKPRYNRGGRQDVA